MPARAEQALRARGQALALVPVLADHRGPALVRGPVQVDLRRPAKRLVLRVLRRVAAVDVRSIPRRRKAP